MNTPRPRSYRLQIDGGFADSTIATYDAVYAESSERLIDLIYQLEPKQVCDAPSPANISIAQLVKHVAWGECQWIQTISGVEIPAALGRGIEGGSPADFIGQATTQTTAAELCELLRSSRYDYSQVSLKTLTDVDQPIGSKSGPSTVREVLMHLVWHWTYHTGQVGLLRDFVGAEYGWCFEPNDDDS